MAIHAAAERKNLLLPELARGPVAPGADAPAQAPTVERPYAPKVAPARPVTPASSPARPARTTWAPGARS